MRRLLAASPILLLLLFLVPACDPGADSPRDPLPEDVEPVTPPMAPDTAGALAAVYDFHQALARGDSASALALLHEEAEIFEAGHPETVEEYRQSHLAADIEFAAAVEREVTRERVISLGEAVLYLAETRARGTFRGRSVDSAGVETMVLAPADGDWRIMHVHWSAR